MDASDATPLIWGQERHPEQTAHEKQNALREIYAFPREIIYRRRTMSHYTQQQVQAAQHTDLVSFLASRGETTVRKGRDSLWEKHQVWINGHEWFSHYEHVGGHAIAFVQRFYGLKFPDAVRELIGTDASECVPVPASLPPPKEKKPLVLPERNPAMDRVTAYLTGKRFLSPEVCSVFAGVNPMLSGTLESIFGNTCQFRSLGVSIEYIR